MDASGNQIAAATIDGLGLFDLQDLVANSVVKDLSLGRGKQRTPTPSGLDTPSEQDRYLQAIGLLQRYDLRDGVEKALGILQKLAQENPNSALVQAALARANLAMFDFTREPDWAKRALAASDSARALDPQLPEVDVTVGETLLATGKVKEAVVAFLWGPLRAARQCRGPHRARTRRSGRRGSGRGGGRIPVGPSSFSRRSRFSTSWEPGTTPPAATRRPRTCSAVPAERLPTATGP